MHDPTLSQLLAISLINGEEAAEPHGLPKLAPGKHRYLGTLPLKLRHIFVAIEQVRVSELQRKSPTGGSATTTSCIIFDREVGTCFKLAPGTEFEICAGFQVALKLQDTAVTEPPADEFVKHEAVRFCTDMASY